MIDKEVVMWYCLQNTTLPPYFYHSAPSHYNQLIYDLLVYSL